MSDIDRIRSLPECLIHHILSFLTTKESVRSSVLSKRWINIWKSVPCIDLNASDFNQFENFENFGDFIFSHKLSPSPDKLDTFNLTWHNCNEDYYETIECWIYNLIPLKPRVVNIVLSSVDHMNFLSCLFSLFNCSKLESLFLSAEADGFWVCCDPDVVNLSSLRSLHLAWVSLENEFMKRLIYGCPILEELVIEYCLVVFSENICSSYLKKLVILNSAFDADTMLRVCCPSLEYLSCEIRLGRISCENLKSLEYARVILHSMKRGYEGKAVKFLRNLSNAKIIQLSGSYVRNMFEKEASNLPMFEKLESLDLGHFTITKDLEPIDSFLRCTPNLKKLTLRHVSMEKHGVLQSRGFNEIHCGSLKTVEIVCPKTCEDGQILGHTFEAHVLVKYLRKHLKALENISINLEDTEDDAPNSAPFSVAYSPEHDF